MALVIFVISFSIAWHFRRGGRKKIVEHPDTVYVDRFIREEVRVKDAEFRDLKDYKRLS